MRFFAALFFATLIFTTFSHTDASALEAKVLVDQSHGTQWDPYPSVQFDKGSKTFDISIRYEDSSTCPNDPNTPVPCIVDVETVENVPFLRYQNKRVIFDNGQLTRDCGKVKRNIFRQYYVKLDHNRCSFSTDWENGWSVVYFIVK